MSRWRPGSRHILALAGCFGIGACSHESDEPAIENDGSLDVREVFLVDLFDSESPDGDPFASGSVRLVDAGIGTWTITPASGRPQIPLGSGELRWIEAYDGLVVELHPNLIDNNVELQVAGEHGTWRYLTDAGVTESGTLRVKSESVGD